MQIDLTKQEMELLDAALKAWVGEPISTGLSMSMLSAAMGRRVGVSLEQQKLETNREIDAAKQASLERERLSLVLRAKLVMALQQAAPAAAIPV